MDGEHPNDLDMRRAGFYKNDEATLHIVSLINFLIRSQKLKSGNKATEVAMIEVSFLYFFFAHQMISHHWLNSYLDYATERKKSITVLICKEFCLSCHSKRIRTSCTCIRIVWLIQKFRNNFLANWGTYTIRYKLLFFYHFLSVYISYPISLYLSLSLSIYIYIYSIPPPEISIPLLLLVKSNFLLKQGFIIYHIYHIYQPLRSGRIWHKVNF